MFNGDFGTAPQVASPKQQGPALIIIYIPALYMHNYTPLTASNGKYYFLIF
jgi:hypothetical protein